MGKADKIWVFLKEVYDVFAMHDVDIWLKYVIGQWAAPILDLYGLAFSKDTVDAPHSGLYRDMRDGKILLALVHYFSPVSTRQNFRRAYRNPQTPEELCENLRCAFEGAASLELPVWWTPEEFLANPGIHLEFVKQQLYYVYRRLKDQKGEEPGPDEIQYRDDPDPPTREEAAGAAPEEEEKRPGPAHDEEGDTDARMKDQEEEEDIPQGLFSQLIKKRIPEVASVAVPAVKRDLSVSPARGHPRKEQAGPSSSYTQERKAMMLEERLLAARTGKGRTHLTNETAHFAGGAEDTPAIMSPAATREFVAEEGANSRGGSKRSSPIVLKKPEKKEEDDETGEPGDPDQDQQSLNFSGIDEEIKEILRSDKGGDEYCYGFSGKDEDKDASGLSESEGNSQGEDYDSTHENVVDPNFLLSYLMSPQILHMSINHSKFQPYMFKLVPSHLMHMYFQQHYYFVWTDLETMNVVSSLDITHIKDVRRQDNQNCFAIVLFSKHTSSNSPMGGAAQGASPMGGKSASSPRSVSGSSTSYIVRCESADDCYKYVTGLNYFAEEVRAEFATMSPSMRKALRRELAMHPVATVD